MKFITSTLLPSTTQLTSTAFANVSTNVSTCDDPPHFSAGNTAYTICMTVLLVFSIFGNATIILAVLLSTKLTDRSSTFYFVASLGLSDMVIAIFQIPFRISVILQGKMFCLGLAACYLRIMMDAFGNITSILNLFFIAMDRFIAIQLPYRYVLLLPHSRARRIIVTVWASSACWSILSIFNWKSSDDSRMGTLSIRVKGMCENTNLVFFLTSFYGIYLPILLLMTCTYIRILQIALSQIKKININTPVKSSRQNSLEALHNKKHPKRRKGNLRKELKATKSVALVYLAFCICWLPSCVIQLILFFKQMKKVDKDTRFMIWLVFLDILPALNTMNNPIIYSFSNRQFRRAIRDVWRKFHGKSPTFGSIYSASECSRTHLDRTSDGCIGNGHPRCQTQNERLSYISTANSVKSRYSASRSKSGSRDEIDLQSITT